MHSLSKKLSRTRGLGAKWLALATIIAGHLPAQAQDANFTKQIWRLKFGVSATQLADTDWLKADADGDGTTNGDEIAAGTNPFVPSVTMRVKTITKNGSNVDLTFPTTVGKRYRAEASSSLSSPNWVLQPVGSPTSVMGTGNDVTLTVPYVADNFYRIRVDEIDTDGDGISDWAEQQAGLNPNSAQSSPGVNDSDFVTGQLAVSGGNVVNIKASSAFASKDGPTPGQFVVTRTQKLLPQRIFLNNAGSTAVAPNHYSALTQYVDFAAGEDTKTIMVNPAGVDNLTNPPGTGSKSVKEAIVAAAPGQPGFDIGPNGSATVIIGDTTVASGTGLTGRYYNTASSTYANAANFGQTSTYNYTRNTTTTGVIVVSYTPPAPNYALSIGNVVRLTFTGGNLNSATYNNLDYTVSAVTGTSFTVPVTNAALPASSASTCAFAIQSFPHPPTLERTDPTVNFEFQMGTANNNSYSSAVSTQTNNPDNYSSTWEGYLNPTSAAEANPLYGYIFQLDADDKARVFLDLNRDGTFGAGEQILEFNWDTAATPGTFKQSAVYPLAVPTTPTGATGRYKIRVEMVETTGNARCMLQWKGTSNPANVFANISQSNQFTHTEQGTYLYTRASATAGTATVTLVNHGLSNGDSVVLDWANGNLFTPNTADPAGYSKSYQVSNVTTNTFDVAIVGSGSGSGLPASQTSNGAVFLENRPNSTTTGLFNKIYPGTAFDNSGALTPGRIGVDAAVTASNNGNWGSGSPDFTKINFDNYSVRWTGQIQPQYSEDYTLIVQADDGCALYINGQPQVLRMNPSAITGGSSYTYEPTTGNLAIWYTGLAVPAGNFVVGETVRIDPAGSNLNHAPSVSPTYTYDSTTGNAVIDYTNLIVGSPGGTRTAGSYTVGEVVELDPTTGNAQSLVQFPYTITAVDTVNNKFTVNFGANTFASGSGNVSISDNRNVTITDLYLQGPTYTYNSTSGDLVINYSGINSVLTSQFTGGQSVTFEPITGNLASLPPTTGNITTVVANTSFTVNIGAGLFTNGSTGSVNLKYTVGGNIPQSATNAFLVNIGAGKYPSTVGQAMNIDIVSKPMKDWSSNGNERYVRLPMVAGKRYNIQLDYYESTGYARSILSWFSASQPKQVIPTERLYPSTGTLAPGEYTSATEATALVGGVFSQPISVTNGGTVTINGPAWLTYANGVLSGTPPSGTAGDYQVTIDITTGGQTTSSVINLHVTQNAGTVVRDAWTGISGTAISSIPVTTAPSATGNLTSLEGPSDVADNFGARIRGYITAPTTGNYYFWVAGNDSAEFWLSNDSEPVNVIKRCWITGGSATPRNWTVSNTQKSAWLALEQGQKYYFEVYQKAGTGSDNVAVGWAKPGQATTTPSEVVPGYVLSPYIPPATGTTPGTLYIATMLAESGVTSNGVGSATLRVNDDETIAYLKFSFSNLSGNNTTISRHIHIDANGTHIPGEIVFDIDTPENPGDGLITNPSDPFVGYYKWTITSHGTYTNPADIREAIRSGKAYINLHTVAYANGEIRGNFTLANGARTFTAPPAPPAWVDDSSDAAAVQRFLSQATFGPNIADIAALQALSASGATNSKYETWIDNEFNKAATYHLPEVLTNELGDVFGPFDVKLTFDAWWKNSMTASDQLRQRVAFALSQIHVVSGQGPLEDNSRAISDFYDTLVANAFGNFRTTLQDTTLTPAMGRYLDMLGNDKPDLSVGRSPNENYAREIKQLFSIGLFRQWPDGSLVLDSSESPIATYTQREIVGLAHVFTGWYYGYDGADRTAFNAAADWTRPMRVVPARHYTGPKRLLNNEVLPGLQTLGGQTLDPYATHSSNAYTDQAYKDLPTQELNYVHDMLFNHPNTGPFVCRQLIQRMVTSNPSRGYLYRVVQKFNDNGSGVRGDMKAVIKAILLDYEARTTSVSSGANLVNESPAYGKQREPIMRVANAARAFRLANQLYGTYSQTNNIITVNSTASDYTTAANHRLLTNGNVFLDFTDSSTPTAQPAPTAGVYAVTSAPSATQFTIKAPGWYEGTWAQSANSSTITVTTSSGHWVPAGGQCYIKFLTTTGGGTPSADQVYTCLTSNATDTPDGSNNVPGTTFTFNGTTTHTAARNGTLMIARFAGSYSSTGAGGVITIDTTFSSSGGSGNASGTYGGQADNNLQVGDTVFLNFTNSRDTTSFNETSTENDIVYTVASVIDRNTFTVAARSAANAAINSDNQVVVFPLSRPPVTSRTGTLTRRSGTYQLDNTDTDLQQTPLNSPTVFNFFLPDYKFSGLLASQGVTTPEFQLTAHTTVVRQSNYIYNGIFPGGPGGSSFISGFYGNGNSNGLALPMDFTPWLVGSGTTLASATNLGLGAPTSTTRPWTSNENVAVLINQLNTLLAGGRLDSNAINLIKDFVALKFTNISATSPAVFTTERPHNFVTGDQVYITGVTGGSYNGVTTTLDNQTTVRSVTVTGASTFTITNLNCSTAPTAPQLQFGHVSPVLYSNSSGNTTTAQAIDRLRAIVHLILTSPDYTIQR